MVRSLLIKNNIKKKIKNIMRPFLFESNRLMKILKIMPFTLHLEISSICNLRCKMCPLGQEKIERKNKFLSLKDVKKIMKNNSLKIKSISLSNWGEPLMNPEITDIIKYLKSLDIKKVGFVTNGLLLDKNMFHKLRKSGLDAITISCDIKYDEMRKISFEEWKEKIIEVLKDNSNFPIEINTIITKGDKPEEYKKIIELFKPYVSKFHVQPLITFQKHNLSPKKICKDLLKNHLLVLSDGRIVPCCVDYNADLILGNAKKDDLKQALERKKYFLNLWQKGTFKEICQKCHEEKTFVRKRFNNFFKDID